MNQNARFVHLFLSIFPPRSKDRPPRLVKPRDGTAGMLVVDGLQTRQGYRLGNVLFNFPPFRDSTNQTLEAVDANAAQEDLLLTGGRVPVNENDQGYRRTINRGYTTLEQAIIQTWAKYLRVSSRGHTLLCDWLCPLLEDKGNRADIFFYMNESAYYKQLGRREVSGSRSTAAFLLRERELWEGGPGYLGFFGMSSETTLVLAHQLRHDHSDLLCDPAFVMFELTGPPIPPRPTDMRFADDWKAEVMFRHPL
jgi:hypothetical protein